MEIFVKWLDNVPMFFLIENIGNTQTLKLVSLDKKIDLACLAAASLKAKMPKEVWEPYKN